MKDKTKFGKLNTRSILKIRGNYVLKLEQTRTLESRKVVVIKDFEEKVFQWKSEQFPINISFFNGSSGAALKDLDRGSQIEVVFENQRKFYLHFLEVCKRFAFLR